MTREQIVSVLKALGVSSLVLKLSGGGDSGSCELDAIEWNETHADGSPVVKLNLEQIPHPRGNLESVICSETADWPDDNWWDGDGGQGEITIRPNHSEDAWECIEVDMSYNEPNWDDDGDDEIEQDEEFIEEPEEVLAKPIKAIDPDLIDDIEQLSERRI